MIFINSARVIEAEPLTLAEGTETRESELIGQMKDISLDNQRESELVEQSMENPLQLSWILFEHSQNPKERSSESFLQRRGKINEVNNGYIS